MTDCIQFSITEDLITENTEFFRIRISVPEGAVFSSVITSATVNIFDNDRKSIHFLPLSLLYLHTVEAGY